MKFWDIMRKIAGFIAILLVVVLAGSSMPASAKTKAKTEAKMSKSSVHAEMGERFSLRLKSSYEAERYWADIQRYNTYYHSYEYYYGAECEEKGEGKFTFSFPEGGKYIIIIGIETYDVDSGWNYYTDKCEVEIDNVGPAKRRFALLIGTSTQLEFERSEMMSITVREPETPSYWWWDYYDYYDDDDYDDYNDYDDYDDYDDYYGYYGYDSDNDYYDYYYDTGKVTVEGNTITAVEAGRVTLDVTYRTLKGETKSEELTVDVTDPQFTPYGNYMLAGNYYYPSLDGTSYYSEYELESSKEEVIEVRGSYFYIKDAGTARLTITVDGRTFTEKITVYAPKISDSLVLMKKKKSHQLTVTGLPDDITPVFRSNNKKIAGVTEDGLIKAKAAGATYITVECGDLLTFVCSVTVGKGGTGMAAAKQAYSHIGSNYSQEKRMSDGYFDCSSLAWRSYNEIGTALADAKTYAPTAAGLAETLEKEGKAIAYEYVSADELLPGDLIFYSSGSNSRYMKIDHVSVFYGAYYGDVYYGGDYNSGAIVQAVSRGVSLDSYSDYQTYNIVMICRPTTK